MIQQRTVSTLVATLLVGLAVIVAACGEATPTSPSPVAVVATPSPSASPSPSPTPSPSPSPTPVPTPTPEPTPVMAIAPLTGRLVEEPLAGRHPIAVMIDDLWAARPQSGLSQASVVWHAPAEGGIPRYMAIFAEGEPKSVGPIRSARMYYIAWAGDWNAVFVHAGGSPQAIAYLRTSKARGDVVFDANVFHYGQRYSSRIKSRRAPHNIYSDAKRLWALAKKVGAKPIDREPAWVFAPDADLARRPVGGSITVPYPANKIVYKYHRESNTYRRSVSGEGKQVDASNKTRIAPSNVVVMFMRFGPLNGGDSKGRLEADYIGSGPALISTNGKTIRGTWAKKSMTGPTRFFDKAGNAVTLTIGQTFVQVVRTGTKVTFVNGKVPAASPSPSGSPGVSPSPSS